MKKLILLSALLLLPFSLDAKPEQEETEAQEKVCFCHNVNHDPHTVCTADEALIEAHMDHVYGEVPGVQDSLGTCEEEAPPEEDDEGDDEEDEEGDDGQDGDDGDDDDDQDADDEEGDDQEDGSQADDFKDDQFTAPGDSELPGEGPAAFFEGSGGCTLNPGPATSSGLNWIWLTPLTTPLLLSLRRKTRRLS